VPQATPETIVKLMSLDAREFRRGLALFAPEIRNQGIKNDYSVGGKLRIAIEELEPFSPGGLLILPQCRITLKFHGMDEQERTKTLARFDRTFFRGGG